MKSQIVTSSFLFIFAKNKTMLHSSEIEEMVSPCDYTVAEAEQRIIQSTADADANRDCMTNTEFRNQLFHI